MPSSPSLVAVAACLSALCVPVAAQDEPQSWRLAMGYLQRGLHQEAAGQLRVFLRDSPGHPRASEARYRLGTCELELGRLEPAVVALQAAARDRALSLRPECLYRLAGALQELGRPGDALQRYQELLEGAGEAHYLVAAAHFGAGEAARDGGDDTVAAQHFVEAAARAPADDAAGYRFAGLYQAGYALLRAGRADDAAATLTALVERFPQHEACGEVFHLLGEASFRAGRVEVAEAAWERSAALGGEFADDARSGIAWSRRQRGDVDGALAAYRELLRHDPAPDLEVAATLEIGRILLDRGDASGAVSQVGDLSADRQAAAAVRRAALEIVGLARLAQGDPAAARSALEQAAAGAAPADGSRLRYAMAECDAAAGDAETALEGYLAAARTDDPELRGDALYGAVLALHAAGRHQESMRRAAELAVEVPDHRLVPYAELAVAENLFALARYGEARERFEGLPADHPLGCEARGKAAWCAWLLGEAGDAQPLFIAVAEDDDQPEATREEALSMAALAALTAGHLDQALALADTYRARHARGVHLARTERVAARVLRQRGELGAAAERLGRAARAESDGEVGVAVALERADVLFAKGDFRAASREFARHAQRSDGQGARAIEGLAWCTFELGDGDGCQRWIDAGVDHPAAGDVAAGLRELRVTLHHRAADWAAARAAAQEFLDQHPEHPRAPEVRFALGTALARGGDPSGACAVLQPLATQSGLARPDLVRYELGWASRKAGDAAAARVAFAEAAEIASDRALADECRVLAAELDLEANARDRARDLLGDVEHPAHRGRARYLLAQSWLADDRLDRAFEAFASVVELGPDEPLFADALFAAGETAHRAGRFEEAVAAFDRLLEGGAENATALRVRLLLGESLVRVGRPADALGQLRAFVTAADEEPSAVRARGYLWVGRAHQARGEHGDAEAAFATAAELSSGDVAAEAWYRTGESRRSRGDAAGAADAFVRVSILYAHQDWVPRSLLEAGRCFAELGQQDRATRLWAELVERFPDSEEARTVARKVRRGGGR